MKKTDQIDINKFGQGLVDIEYLVRQFESLDDEQKVSFIWDIVFLINQSKPIEGDIDLAIQRSGLKSTFTPCILIKKGSTYSDFKKIIDLPITEIKKTHILFLSLYRVAYERRYSHEKDNPNKWWYWDLSKSENIDLIKNDKV